VFKRDHASFWLPSGDGDWIPTGPEYNDAFLSRRNTELGSHLKPFSRMLKQWNRTHGNRLRGFHLEVIAQQSFTNIGSNYRTAFKLFFHEANRFLQVRDPAGFTDDLSATLTSLQRREVLDSFDSAAERASRAVDAEGNGDHREAIRLWGIVFGDEFPAYG
jgi:hypothetical protein